MVGSNEENDESEKSDEDFNPDDENSEMIPSHEESNLQSHNEGGSQSYQRLVGLDIEMENPAEDTVDAWGNQNIEHEWANQWNNVNNSRQSGNESSQN